MVVEKGVEIVEWKLLLSATLLQLRSSCIKGETVSGGNRFFCPSQIEHNYSIKAGLLWAALGWVHQSHRRRSVKLLGWAEVGAS